MTRTRIKFCGLTRPVEAEWACALGVDAIGLVFYDKSPRAVTIARANLVLAEVAPFVTVTGLFMNAGRDQVNAVLDEVKLDLLQFHGDEDAAYCGGFERRYIKAIPMGGRDLDPDYAIDYVRSHPAASAFLLDSNCVGKAGGTGETFAWQKVPEFDRPVVLAGGIHDRNVGNAIKTVRPYGIDVSSGIEKERGVKDHETMKKFVQEVRFVDHEY